MAPDAKWDFIRSSNAVPYLTQDNIRGAIPPADFNGIAVQGSYGKAWLIESNVVPEGYVAVVASGGLNSPDNPVAVRHHPNPNYQGLRWIPGPTPFYRSRTRLRLAVSGLVLGPVARLSSCR